MDEKLRLLEALKKSSKDVQTKPTLSTIHSLLQLQTQLRSLLSSSNPTLFNLSLSDPFSDLKNHLENKLQTSTDHTLRSKFRCCVKSNHDIARLTAKIVAQVQAFVDRERISNLVEVLREPADEEEKLKALVQFEDRLSSGFDRGFQEVILRSRVLQVLELIVHEANCSTKVREESARAILGLVRFNKDVFVGELLMGPTVRSLVSNPSSGSIKVLSSLVKRIKSPLVYEIEANGYITKIVNFLSSKNESIRVSAMDLVFELAHFCRKQGIESMLDEGLVTRLVEWRRERGECTDDWKEGENRGDFVETEAEFGSDVGSEEKRLMEKCRLWSSVSRFVVQLEKGEGLEKGEKMELKEEILRRVREASVSDAEARSIFVGDEVFWWGSSFCGSLLVYCNRLKPLDWVAHG